MRFGDEAGLFWADPIKEKARVPIGDRPLPPIPDTGWKVPTEFPCLAGQGMIAVDVETYDPDLKEKGCGSMRGAYIAGVALATEAGFCQYYPVAHKDGPNLDKARVFEWVSEQLMLEVPKIGANIRYDLEMLSAEGVKSVGPYYDVQIAEPLLNENKLQYSLESLAQEYLGEGKETDLMYAWMIDAFGKGNAKGNIWRAPPQIVGPYAESDVDLPIRIFRIQKKKLEEQGLWDLFMLETRLLPMLVAMRRRGVRVNEESTDLLIKKMEDLQDQKLKELKRLTGKDIDIWSAESLAHAYDAAGVSYLKTAKTKKPSFTKEWLNHNDHPLSKMIVDARYADKFKGTFLEGYLRDGRVNGRIHTNFNQLKSDDGGTISGRLSSSGPNLQNIPVRTEEGRLIRAAFLPDEDQQWWAADWSQIEYRLIAHYAFLMKKKGAAEVVDRYINDPDIDYHKLVAELTGLSRSNAKNLNFGLAYGQGIDLLCSNLGVDREEGLRIIRTYHERAPFIKPLMKDVSDITNERGFLKTILGRRRRFDTWEKKGPDGNQIYRQDWAPGFRRAFLHKALNALIQGSAADLMKKAMVEYWESGVVDVLGVPHLTVHDELDGSMPLTQIGWEAFHEVKYIMENTIKVSVPIIADVGVGLNWAEAKHDDAYDGSNHKTRKYFYH